MELVVWSCSLNYVLFGVLSFVVLELEGVICVIWLVGIWSLELGNGGRYYCVR